MKLYSIYLSEIRRSVCLFWFEFVDWKCNKRERAERTTLNRANIYVILQDYKHSPRAFWLKIHENSSFWSFWNYDVFVVNRGAILLSSIPPTIFTSNNQLIVRVLRVFFSLGHRLPLLSSPAGQATKLSQIFLQGFVKIYHYARSEIEEENRDATDCICHSPSPLR